MIKLRLSKEADRFLRKIPAKHGKQIALRIQALQENPSATPTEDVKGYPPFRRLKSGEYRVIYFIADGTLNVTLIGKRNDNEIYRQIKRMRR